MFKRFSFLVSVLVIGLVAFSPADAQRKESYKVGNGDRFDVQPLLWSHAGLKQTVSDTLIGDGDVDSTDVIDCAGADKVSLNLNVRWMDTNDADSCYVSVATSYDGSNWTAYTTVDTILGTNDLSNTYYSATLYPPPTRVEATPASQMATAGIDPSSVKYISVRVSTGTDEAGTDSLNVQGYITKVYNK